MGGEEEDWRYECERLTRIHKLEEESGELEWDEYFFFHVVRLGEFDTMRECSGVVGGEREA